MVALEVEVSHTNLTEVTRMVLVEVSTVVVLSNLLAISSLPISTSKKSYLTTGHTTTTGVLTVLSDTTVTGGDMTAVLPRFGESGRHGGGCCLLLSTSRLQGARRKPRGQIGLCVVRLDPDWVSADYFCVCRIELSGAALPLADE